MTTETAPELSGPAAPGVPTTHSHEEAGSVMYGCAGFVLDGSSDRVAEVGPPIVLTRGVLAEITVVNHLDEPTAVHWHGIELESLFDSVPGWAGLGSPLAPEILAARSSRRWRRRACGAHRRHRAPTRPTRPSSC
jgi:hypothetical protein